MSLGFAVAAVAFGALIERVGIGTILPTYAIVLLTLPLWSMLGTLPSARPARGQVHSRLGAVGAFFKAAPRLGAILPAMLLVAVGVSASFTFVPLRIGGLGGGPLLVGVAVALGASVEVPVMASGGRIQEAIGLRGVYVLGTAIYVGVFVVLSTLSSPVALTFVVAINGIAFALVYVGAVVIVHVLVPPSLRATGQGLRQAVVFGVGPILGTVRGLVFARLGAPALFVGAAGSVAAGAALAWSALTGPEFARGPRDPERRDDADPVA